MTRATQNPKIIITDRHFNPQPSLNNYAYKKALKLLHHFDHIENITITIDKDIAHRNKLTTYQVNIRISLPGKNLNLNDEGPNMTQTIDSAIHRLDRELIKTKEKFKNKRNRPGVRRLSSFLKKVKIKKFRRKD